MTGVFLLQRGKSSKTNKRNGINLADGCNLCAYFLYTLKLLFDTMKIMTKFKYPPSGVHQDEEKNNP